MSRVTLYEESQSFKLVWILSFPMGLASFETSKFRNTIYIIWSLVLSICIIIITIWTIFQQARDWHGFMTITIFDCILNVLILIMPILSMYNCNFGKKQRIQKSLIILSKIRNTMKKELSKSGILYQEKNILIHLIFLWYIMLVHMSVELATEIPVIGISPIDIVYYFSLSALVTFLLQIINFVSHIDKCFEFLNNHLQGNHKDRRIFLIMYNDLCDLMGLVGDTFGHQISVFVALIITTLLNNVNKLMKENIIFSNSDGFSMDSYVHLTGMQLAFVLLVSLQMARIFRSIYVFEV